MSLSANAIKAVAVGLANQSAATEVNTAVNNGNALATLVNAGATGQGVIAAIVATATSTTTNFGILAVGDTVVHIPAVAGNSIFWTVATAGTLPAAAVVGDLYLVLRAFTLPAAVAPAPF